MAPATTIGVSKRDMEEARRIHGLGVVSFWSAIAVAHSMLQD